MTPEIIIRNGKNYAVIPYEFYQQLMEDAEMLSDVKAYDLSKQEAEENFPESVVYSIIFNGENPVKVYREYRNLTQAQLAEKSKISLDLLREIERNINCASLSDLKAIAQVLNLDLDMISND